MAIIRAHEASSSTSPPPCSYYHVFLSFRGEDTRKTFTDHLYTALVQAGLSVFRDNDEIERGGNLKWELDKAIKGSQIAIIVFSKDYASSKWCLDELAMILEWEGTSRHTAFPVFYDVEPSEVRNQRGSFADAFSRYEEQLINAGSDTETGKGLMKKVQGWRAALRRAADLAGMELRNEADGHEARFIQKIVRVTEEKLNRTVLRVPHHLVGKDFRVQNIHLWLQDESADANILVIYGVGGIGKTTIAKIAYNLNFQRFDSSSFVANVKQHAEQFDGILELQKQVLSNILKGKKGRPDNVDEGSIKINQAICSKRVLVVLDDVDELDQFDALLGTPVLYPGSKIIITTRRKGLLGAHPAHKEHKVKFLDYDESLKLFSWHSFGQDHPVDGYVEQSKRLVWRCNGLPLALQVLGSSLLGKSIDIWEGALSKLEEIPHTAVQKVLETSYYALKDDCDQNLFLHIACFFIGEEKDYTVKILENCGLHPIFGIDRLIDRCLLTIEQGNKLMMHQLIQEMGKEIVRKESPKEPGRRSRLWRHEDSIRVLKEKSGTETIEGLILDISKFQKDRLAFTVGSVDHGRSLKRPFSSLIPWEWNRRPHPNEGYLDVDAFAGMKNIQLLQLNYVQLTGNYEDFPIRLRWLCWHGFPLEHVPVGISLENLVVLDLRHSKLKQFGEGTKHLGSLKTLDLSYSDSLARILNFSRLPYLEKLILQGCVGLLDVCESIGFIKGLDFLDLEDCTSLKKLPSNIGLLNFLQELNISGCSSLVDLSLGLGKMKSLSVLRANDLSLKPLPSATGEVTPWHTFFQPWVSKPERSVRNILVSLPSSLVELSFRNCNLSDDSFPKSFGNLSSLETLDLSHNPIRSLPDCIRSLNGLKYLWLEECTRLQSIEGLPSASITLLARWTTSLERISFLSLEGISYSFLSHTFLHLVVQDSQKLVEIEGYLKRGDIWEADKETINNLGLCDIESLKNIEMDYYDRVFTARKNLPIQGFHEFGIFSTFVPSRMVMPGWFSVRTKGRSISFTVPYLADFTIRCLNICCVYVVSGDPYAIRWSYIVITNKTKDLTWAYKPTYSLYEGLGEDWAWLSQWKFGNQLESGDEVIVTFKLSDGISAKECGYNFVYQEGRGGEDELENETNKHDGIGGDLPDYQLIPGLYYLRYLEFDLVVDEIKREGRRHKWTDTFVDTITSFRGGLYAKEFHNKKQALKECCGCEDRLSNMGLSRIIFVE